MNPSGGNPGVSKLAQVMAGWAGKREEARAGLLLDFGTIQADGSLVTDTFPIPIPPGDYLVCRHLTLGAAGGALAVTGEGGTHTHKGGDHRHAGGSHGGHAGGGTGDHAHDGGDHTHSGDGGHTHTVLVPEKLRSLQGGDRVLVGWRGEDAIVIDVILPAGKL